MDHGAIALHLARKGLSAVEIHVDLVATLGPNRWAIPATFPFARRNSRLRSQISFFLNPNRSSMIQMRLSTRPEWIALRIGRHLASHNHLLRLTRYRRLTQTLSFRVWHLRWVFHRLSDPQKSKRVALSEELWSILESQKRRAWHNSVTLDESEFSFRADHELIWLQPSEEVPEREQLTIQSLEVMLTMVWNPTNFHVINVLGKGSKFNATHYLTKIL
jgi:hypothetical protein